MTVISCADKESMAKTKKRERRERLRKYHTRAFIEQCFLFVFRISIVCIVQICRTVGGRLSPQTAMYVQIIIGNAPNFGIDFDS